MLIQANDMARTQPFSTPERCVPDTRLLLTRAIMSAPKLHAMDILLLGRCRPADEPSSSFEHWLITNRSINTKRVGIQDIIMLKSTPESSHQKCVRVEITFVKAVEHEWITLYAEDTVTRTIIEVAIPQLWTRAMATPLAGTLCANTSLPQYISLAAITQLSDKPSDRPTPEHRREDGRRPGLTEAETSATILPETIRHTQDESRQNATPTDARVRKRKRNDTEQTGDVIRTRNTRYTDGFKAFEFLSIEPEGQDYRVRLIKLHNYSEDN